MPGEYTPDLPQQDWQAVRGFVRDVVSDVENALPYPRAALLNAVAHHVDWTVYVAYMPLDRGSLFRRDVIGAAVAVMPTTSPSTKGRRRSILLRVGEALGVIPVLTTLAPLSAATPQTPYNAQEITALRAWAYAHRRAAGSLSARALLAIGLGAGLPTRDLIAVTAADIQAEGSRLTVNGRKVPVRDEWMEELDGLARAAVDGSRPLFRPRVARTRNVVTEFVRRSSASGQGPSTQRMRATWLVMHLADGMPMHELLYAAGVASMDALVRYETFLPKVSS